ncbi:MAG: cytochrome c oxidase subunit II [Cytophagales bacterium]|nr:cytochrome c oxidase subunit II [Cytophagales bacterium]
MLVQIQHIFQSASSDADAFNWLFNAFLAVSGFIILLVSGLIAWTVYKFRAKQAAVSAGQIPASTSRKVEILTFGLAGLLVAVFLVFTVRTIYRVQTPPRPGQQPDLTIVGHQWWWEIRYPDGTVTANELHIPAGRRLWVRLESADVIHDWYVPALGRKMDMIPGMSNYVWMQAREKGVYEGACNEYCGAQHAWMRIRVTAHSPEDFRRWLGEEGKSAREPKNELAKKGKELFHKKVCAGCHSIRGHTAGDSARIGPDLTHLASRKYILGGKEPNSLGALRAWISNPQAVKPGAHMPNFNLSPEEIEALAAYLNQLK